jgi:transcriptional regulator GlxA family with amidase domain
VDVGCALVAPGQRVEGARRLLETADLSVAEVAAAWGFGRVETTHRACRRGIRVSPGQYRRHFRAVS